jgi:hypothetical protein
MRKLISLILVLSLILALSAFISGAPNGVIVSPGTSSRGDSTGPDDDPNAIAGNITGLTITGVSTTQAWQGYFGNVSGTIQLANSANNVMYNWSLASPKGEIYASNASTITWNGIQCYDELTNLSEFEQRFGVGVGDADGLNETFNLNNHPEFYTNNVQFTTGLCKNTKLYNSAGAGTFDEVLLTDGPSLVFTSLLSENSNGFDNVPHDFEMLVLENGHGIDTSPTTYYFWAELE